MLQVFFRRAAIIIQKCYVNRLFFLKGIFWRVNFIFTQLGTILWPLFGQINGMMKIVMKGKNPDMLE